MIEREREIVKVFEWKRNFWRHTGQTPDISLARNVVKHTSYREKLHVPRERRDKSFFKTWTQVRV